MRVVFLVADRKSASSRLRVLQYVDRLRRDGVDVVVCATRPSKYLWRPVWWPRNTFSRLLYSVAGMCLVILQRAWQIATAVPRADVVFLQKDLLFRSRLRFLERAVFAVARVRRARVVFDLDDAIYLGTSQEHIPRMYAKIAFLARGASVVLAGSPTIATEMRAHTDAVAPAATCITLGGPPDRSYARASGLLRLVWVGTPTNARYLDLLADTVRELSRQEYVEIKVVTRLADLPGGLLAGLAVHTTEWSEIAEAEALRSADIALAPLADDPWTRAKCGGKLLSYFAAAVPVVASSVGVQADLVRHGRTGLVATSPSQWHIGLAMLRDSEDLRRRLGKGGRSLAEAHLCAEAHYPRWRDMVLGAGPT